jgi:hypothetical protein
MAAAGEVGALALLPLPLPLLLLLPIRGGVKFCAGLLAAASAAGEDGSETPALMGECGGLLCRRFPLPPPPLPEE